jgi:SAM-dependent methyltransferase
MYDDTTIQRAYAQMSLDKNHIWTKYTPHEVDVILEALELQPSQQVWDFGCGTGRHILELGRRGYRGVGIDFVESNIRHALLQGQQEKIFKSIFFEADCKTLQVGHVLPGIISLYDVIGSFLKEEDNDAIIQNIASHLPQKGRVLVSVMNLELTSHLAKYKANRDSSLTYELERLPGSHTMQTTGNVFDPEYFLLDEMKSLVYRKELFTNNGLVTEQLVIDRRYSKDQLVQKFSEVGIQEIWTRYVKLGDWNTNLEPTNPRAKEILFLGQKT